MWDSLIQKYLEQLLLKKEYKALIATLEDLNTSHFAMLLSKDLKELKKCLNEKGYLPYENTARIISKINTYAIVGRGLLANFIPMIGCASKLALIYPFTKLLRVFSKTNLAKIMHAIPPTMELKKAKKCVVRISHSEKEIWQGLKEELQYAQMENIRISPTMHVEVTDIEEAFTIRWLTNQTQYIEEDESEFTEWVFYATPCKTGTYPLFITVSAIVEVKGKEHKKDKVFSRSIEITTLPTEETAGFQTLPAKFSDKPKEVIENIVKLIKDNKLAEAFKEIDDLPFPKNPVLETLRKKFMTGNTDEQFSDMLIVYVRSLESEFGQS